MQVKDRLNILSLCEWDYAGVGYLLSEGIKKHTDHTSSHVRFATSTLQYPGEHVKPALPHIRRLWLAADVVHIHDAFNHIPAGLPERPTIITYHGSKYRRNPGGNNKGARANGWLQTVATMDLMPLGPNVWFPDTRNEQHGKLDKYDEFTVCHAPTSRPGKSTATVIEACKIAGIRLELIERETWSKCMSRKARCHVLADQFRLGYGCNAVEAWFYDMPVVAGVADAEVKKLMVKKWGQLPFVQCADNAKELAEHLVKLRDDSHYFEFMRRAGKAHAMKWHSPRATSALAIEMYHKAIDTFMRRVPRNRIQVNIPRPRAIIGDHTMVEDETLHYPVCNDNEVLVRYLGGNIGKETFVGAATGVDYTFSASDRVQPVNSADLDWFLSIEQRKQKPRGKRSKRDKLKNPPLFERVVADA